MIMDTLKLAALCGLIAPFIIVGVGVVLGLTLAISQTMLGMVLGDRLPGAGMVLGMIAVHWRSLTKND